MKAVIKSVNNDKTGIILTAGPHGVGLPLWSESGDKAKARVQDIFMILTLNMGDSSHFQGFS